MKNFIRILTFSLVIILIFSCKKSDVAAPPNNSSVSNDSLPATDTLNYGMEYWTKTVQNNLTYEEPSGWWTSLNSLAKLGGPITISKTTDKHSGKYAVKLESKYWGTDTTATGLLIPGLLTIGTFITAEPFVLQGKPFTAKPAKFQGYFKYTSVKSDSAVIYAKLSKFNQLKGSSDTIAVAKMVVLNSVNSYQLFDLNFDYMLPALTPDSLSIVFVSSGGGQNFKGQAGSTLLIDDIKLVYSKNKKQKIALNINE